MTSHHMKLQTLTKLALLPLMLLTSCSSSPGGGSSAQTAAKPGAVVSEQVVEISGRKYRQQRVLITDVPYETKLQVVPVN